MVLRSQRALFTIRFEFQVISENIVYVPKVCVCQDWSSEEKFNKKIDSEFKIRINEACNCVHILQWVVFRLCRLFLKSPFCISIPSKQGKDLTWSRVCIFHQKKKHAFRRRCQLKMNRCCSKEWMGTKQIKNDVNVKWYILHWLFHSGSTHDIGNVLEKSRVPPRSVLPFASHSESNRLKPK